jgi:hypothetical protein
VRKLRAKRKAANMATKKEEQEEQNFFSEKVKEQTEHERKEHKMAAENDKHKKAETVSGYSGSASEGKKIERPKYASKEAVVSDAGVTEPTIEFGGDGITPKAEFEKNYAELWKKQAEHDKKRREQAVEDAGVIQTTEKHRHAAIVAAEERRHAEAEKQEQAEAEAHKHG